MLHSEADWSKSLEFPNSAYPRWYDGLYYDGPDSLYGQEWGIGIAALVMATLVASFFSSYRNRRKARLEKVQKDFETTLNQCVIFLQNENTIPEGSVNVILDDSAADLLEIEEPEDRISDASQAQQNKRVNSN